MTNHYNLTDENTKMDLWPVGLSVDSTKYGQPNKYTL